MSLYNLNLNKKNCRSKKELNKNKINTRILFQSNVIKKTKRTKKKDEQVSLSRNGRKNFEAPLPLPVRELELWITRLTENYKALGDSVFVGERVERELRRRTANLGWRTADVGWRTPFGTHCIFTVQIFHGICLM